MVGHQPGLVEPHPRVDEPERDRLELVDLAPERLALLRVAHRVLERRAPDPDRARRERHARLLEPPQQPSEPRALLADPPVDGAGRSPAGRARRPGSTGSRAWGSACRARSPRRPSRTTNAVMPFERVPGRHRREHEVPLGERRARDPGLAAVQPVDVPVAFGVRRDRRGVRTRLRLGDREPAQRGLGTGERTDPALALLVGPHPQDRAGEEAVARDRVRDRAVAPGEFLPDQALRQDALEPPAAEGFGEVVAGEADRGRFADHVPGELLGLVVVTRDGTDLAFGEVVGEIDQVAFDLAHAAASASARTVRTSFAFASSVVTPDSRQASRRSRTCSTEPTRQSSSIIASGTRPAASALRPSR